MKTKVVVKTTYQVSEPQTAYKAGSDCSNVLLWVVNSDGSILLKNSKRDSTDARKICELTLEAESLQEIIFKIEKETGILTHKTNVHKVNSTANFEVYFLTVNLDKVHKEVVEDHFHGKFVDYRDVITSLKGTKITDTCKECVLNLISTLYEKYNFL